VEVVAEIMTVQVTEVPQEEVVGAMELVHRLLPEVER
jgi:hypothetical protein